MRPNGYCQCIYTLVVETKCMISTCALNLAVRGINFVLLISEVMICGWYSLLSLQQCLGAVLIFIGLIFVVYSNRVVSFIVNKFVISPMDNINTAGRYTGYVCNHSTILVLYRSQTL